MAEFILPHFNHLKTEHHSSASQISFRIYVEKNAPEVSLHALGLEVRGDESQAEIFLISHF